MVEDPGASLYLWRKRTLYLGPAPGPVRLETASARLLVGLDGTFEIRPRDRRRALVCRAALVPVNFKALVDPGHVCLADCHLDVSGFDYALLRRQAREEYDGISYDFAMPEDLVATLGVLHDDPPEAPELAQRLEELLNPPELVEAVDFRLDPRVRDIIELIHSSAAENLPLASLAARVNLSTSRLVNLFKSQVGIPVRRYRLWHRVFRACCRLAEGDSTTDAALTAGFSDAAHLTHTFRDILGITPSDLFGAGRALRVHVEPVARVPDAEA